MTCRQFPLALALADAGHVTSTHFCDTTKPCGTNDSTRRVLAFEYLHDRDSDRSRRSLALASTGSSSGPTGWPPGQPVGHSFAPSSLDLGRSSLVVSRQVQHVAAHRNG